MYLMYWVVHVSWCKSFDQLCFGEVDRELLFAASPLNVVSTRGSCPVGGSLQQACPVFRNPSAYLHFQ